MSFHLVFFLRVALVSPLKSSHIICCVFWCHPCKDVHFYWQESEGLAMGRGQVSQDFKHVVGCKKAYITGSSLPDQYFDAKR